MRYIDPTQEPKEHRDRAKAERQRQISARRRIKQQLRDRAQLDFDALIGTDR